MTESCVNTLQENVLAEATMIIPDTRQRLEAAYQDLQALLVSAHVHVEVLHDVRRLSRQSDTGMLRLQASDDKELLESPEGTDAQQAIAQHAAAIDSEGG